MTIKANVSDIVIPSEERHIKMYPLDFEEFLWANGNETLMPLIRQGLGQLRPLGDMLHRKAMDLFRQYLIVGGMPQAVREYISSKNFAGGRCGEAGYPRLVPRGYRQVRERL